MTGASFFPSSPPGRQRADCEAHYLTRGREVIEAFCDDDSSA
jgi:hypothetical protein